MRKYQYLILSTTIMAIGVCGFLYAMIKRIAYINRGYAISDEFVIGAIIVAGVGLLFTITSIIGIYLKKSKNAANQKMKGTWFQALRPASDQIIVNFSARRLAGKLTLI